MKAHEYVYISLLPKSEYFCGAVRKKHLYVGVPGMLIYNQNNQFLALFCVHCWFSCLSDWGEPSRLKSNN